MLHTYAHIFHCIYECADFWSPQPNPLPENNLWFYQGKLYDTSVNYKVDEIAKHISNFRGRGGLFFYYYIRDHL